jgi:nucleotide-binding universal stress UspA family protein
MQFRTILAAISGGSASPGAAELACHLARDFKSHLEGFHVRFDPRELAIATAGGFGMPLAGNIMLRAEQDALEAAARARKLFESAVARQAVFRRDTPPPPGSDPGLLNQASACWREEMGYGAVGLAARGRLFDLIILGRSGRVVDEPSSAAIEEALFSTGRPILLAPAEPPGVLGETIAVAWNDSPESAKALGAALPFLTRAHAVHVLALGHPGAGELAQHLAWYGVRATVHSVKTFDNVRAGEILLGAAREHGADLLVMGGYGRSPWREMLFGGATRHVIGTSLLPVLLSH